MSKGFVLVFGRTLCLACQELKKKLTSASYEFRYISLDNCPPSIDYDKNNPQVVAQWTEACLAMVEVAIYQLDPEQPLPIVLHVWADPCQDTDAFRQIDVLQDDGSITLDNLRDSFKSLMLTLFEDAADVVISWKIV